MQEEFARVIEWPIPCSAGTREPQFFSNSFKAILSYIMPFEIDKPTSFAIIEFHYAFATKFGIANDEVFHGLPLAEKGLQCYSAHIIENSSWLNEIKQIHRVHDRFDENRWLNRKHYYFVFHDDIAEIIAEDFSFKTFTGTLKELNFHIAELMSR